MTRRRKPPTRATILARERKRRRYQRRKQCVVVAPVPVGEKTIGLLVRANWLDESAQEDRQCIGLAIARVLDWLGREKK
jgi:hypothetical protein